MGGSHWTCLYVNVDEPFRFDSFGGASAKILLDQLPKPVTFHTYKIQKIRRKSCGIYRLYFSYLTKRMHFQNVFLKCILGQ